MSAFTLEDLKPILLSCADEQDAAAFDGEIEDAELTDLGFDSLAVLDIATRIQQQFHIAIPDEAVEGMKTPADVVRFVSGQLSEPVR